MVQVAFVSNSARGEFTGRFRWIPSLAAEGFKVTFLLPRGEEGYAERMRQAGVPIVHYRLNRHSVASRSDARALRDLTTAIARGRFDIVHSFGHKANMYAGIATALAGTPIRFQHVTGLGDPFMSGPSMLKRWIARVTLINGYRWLARTMAGVFFQNPDDRVRFNFVPGDKAIMTRGTGVNPDEYSPAAVPTAAVRRLRAELGLSLQDRVVTFAGRLKPEKGILDLAAAARLVAADRIDVVFLIVGDADREEARGLLPGLREAPVRLVGRRDDLREILALTDVFVNPSRREGLPRVNLEAMAMMKPVVTTDVPGCRETIVDGREGLVVPSGSPQMLAAAIRRLLSSHQLRAAMGAAGRARVKTEFSVATITRQIADCYRRALAATIARQGVS